ncbi:hypothetical protein [Luteolibacter sp. Populi]|uniref:hypothetical protein n=1 Tax=Luteolibacter sp. Populi TaxID=3230487 RepID=UPI0034653F17
MSASPREHHEEGVYEWQTEQPSAFVGQSTDPSGRGLCRFVWKQDKFASAKPSGPALEEEDRQRLFKTLASFSDLIEEKVHNDLRLGVLEKVVVELSARVTELSSLQPITVEVRTFAPEPYRAKTSLAICVQPSADEFTATYFDAGMSATGDTPTEAVENLKDLIISAFERYGTMDIKKLGPALQKRLAVLNQVIEAL